MRDFINELSSKNPTPGGGGASALVGSIGTALCGMVCNLTIGKKKYEEYEEEIKEVLKESIKIQNRLLELIKEDEENFLPLSKAYSMKANTEEEKKLKEETMEECLKLASKSPLEMIDLCSDAIKLHEKILGKSTILAVSDIGVGVQTLRSAILSAKLNVLININSLKDEEYKERIINDINEKINESIIICDKVYEEVLKRI